MARPDAHARVTLFVPDLTGGGAERMMVQLANGLAMIGVDVDFVLVQARGPYLSQIRPDVRLVTLGARTTGAAVLALARHLRRTRPTAALATLAHANVALVAAGMLAHTPTRILLRESSTPSEAAASARGVKSRLAHALVGLAYRRAHRVVAVSDGAADDIRSFFHVPAERVVTIVNPVVDDDLARSARIDPGEPWFAAGQPPVVVAAGRLGPAKDYPTLLRAMRQVRAHVPARLIILGEGDARQELERLAHDLGLSDHVRLPGFVDNPYAYMARASVFVLSSVREGLPGVLIQAMACGCPVVSTDCPSGPNEILDGGRYGHLVPMRDPQALADAIVRTLEGRPDREALTRRAQAYSVRRSVEQYRQLLFGRSSDDGGDGHVAHVRA